MIERVVQLGRTVGSSAAHARRVLLRRHPQRRYNCQDQAAESWEERAKKAVALLAGTADVAIAGSRLQVADLGAGNQRLRAILEQELVDVEYHPYDLHPQASAVQRLDVERGLPERRFDAVFCLGLLEYLSDLDRFVARLAASCRLAVVSYVLSDAPGSISPEERRDRGWRSDLTREDLERLFARHAFELRAYSTANDESTGLWLWATAGAHAQDQRP